MYPGLKNNEGHDVAKEQMSNFGMMVSINVRGGAKAAEKFINSLKLWYLATSLGGVESTVSYPVLASHVNCSEERFAAAGRIRSNGAALSGHRKLRGTLSPTSSKALKNGEIGTKVYVPLTQSGDCI